MKKDDLLDYGRGNDDDYLSSIIAFYRRHPIWSAVLAGLVIGLMLFLPPLLIYPRPSSITPADPRDALLRIICSRVNIYSRVNSRFPHSIGELPGAQSLGNLVSNNELRPVESGMTVAVNPHLGSEPADDPASSVYAYIVESDSLGQTRIIRGNGNIEVIPFDQLDSVLKGRLKAPGE